MTRGGASTCGTEIVYRIGITRAEARVRELDPSTDAFVTRAEFEAWATRVAETHGYGVKFLPIGPEDPAVGAPSQMGVFSR